MTRKQGTKAEKEGQAAPAKFPKAERLFVTRDSAFIKIESDELGDEVSLSIAKLPQLVAVSLIGMADKEPTLVLQFENTTEIEVPYNSRTSAKTAQGQILQMVREWGQAVEETPSLSP